MSIITNLLSGFKEIFSAFFSDLSLWWLLTPVLILWAILEIYFGEHKKEKLGWNTALGNAVSLCWISLEAMRFLFSNKGPGFGLRFVIILLILLYGIFLIYLSFSHKLSPSLTFTLGSPTPVYFISIFTILWSHYALGITIWVLLDILILFVLVSLIIYLIKQIIPQAEEDLSDSGSFDNSDFSEKAFDNSSSNLSGDLKL